MNKPKYFINGITVRKYCRDNHIPFGSVQHRLAKGMSVEEALNYEFKKRTLNTDTELYGVKRARRISFLKCFEELKELLINGKRDEARKLLDEIYNSRKDIVRF